MMEANIVIVPKTKPLNAAELISMRNMECGSLKVGLKKTKLDGTPEEAAEIAKIYAELKKQLSVPRIEKACGRSNGEWDTNRRAVKILRKEGKFDTFGYSLNGDLYLEYYEALFLLEMNRLEICYYTLPMSIEQAYVLLLGEEESAKFNIYIVYAMLTRVGYILQNYQNLSFESKKPTEEDCVWSILLGSVQHKPIPNDVKNSEHFTRVQTSMDLIRTKIMQQETDAPNEGRKTEAEGQISFERKLPPTKKRKSDSVDKTNYKRPRNYLLTPSLHQSFIDFLQKEEEYIKFADLFQSFDIINLRPPFEHDDADDDDLDIQFDVFLHSDTFKKSEPKPPVFRLAILNRHQKFPNRAQISKCYSSQEYQVPVLVVLVSESKHIQAFLYHFT